MIQLIVGLRAFYSVILKKKFSIQEVISPYSFIEILISSTHWMHK